MKMTKHVHAEMIKAKADNMELVLFSRQSGGLWYLYGGFPSWFEGTDYFLCLPQHSGACLAWLNGGEIQYKTELVIEFKDYQPKIEFSLGSIFMSSEYEIRIKPKKEKLWISVESDRYEHLGGCRRVRICSHAFVNKSDAEEYLDLSGSQLIEIEVEV